MSKSRIGFDLNAALEDDTPAAAEKDEWSDGENDEAGLHQPDTLDEDEGDDDDELFTAAAMTNVRRHSNDLGLSQGRSLLQATANRGGFDMNFLGTIPREVEVDLNAAQRPTLLNLPLAEFKPGVQVWVGDANDVLTIMKSHWEPGLLQVCNGRAVGTVLRHAGENVVVSFPRDDSGVAATFTFPRACLLLEPFPPYEAPFSGSSSKMFADGGGLNPKAGHDKKVPEPKFSLLAPLDRHLTVGSPCKVTEKVLAAIDEDNVELAFSLVEDRKKRLAEVDQPDAILDMDPITAHCSALIAMVQGQPQTADATCSVVRARGGCENITLFLRAWHAKMMLGQYSPAHDLLNHAHLLAPHESAIDVAAHMTSAMKAFANRVKSHQVPLVTSMTYRMERRCVSTRYFVDGDCIALDEPLLTSPSAVIDERQAKLCHHCCGLLPAQDRVPCRRRSEALYCSTACEETAWVQYRKFELEDFGFSYRSAEFLIHQRQNSEHYREEERPLLESAHMACRTVSIVGTCILEDARSSTPDTAALHERLRDKLAELGLFPAPETAVFRHVNTNVEYQIKALHSVLVGRFPEALKQLFDFPTFRSILATVHTYRRTVWIDANDVKQSACFNAITLFTGGIPIWKPRPPGNARLLKLPTGELCLFATAVIDPRSEVIVDQ